MRKYYQHVTLTVALFFLLSVSLGLATDKKQYSTVPPTQASKKWRIGYYEAGAYHNYPKTLIAIVNGLAVLGWIEPVSVPFTEGDKTTDKLWLWLSANIKSKYVEFPADAYYSYNWNKELREKTKQTVLKRLKENRDIDLMIAMGTWAGQDLANNEHSVPTMVCSTSDPIDSKIIKSAADSGYDHVHAHVDPTRYIRQIEAFHDIFDFKKLGVAFIDTDYGRSYAAIEDIRKIAKQRKFEIVECHTLPGTLTPEVATSVIKCAQEIAPKIDAFYMTQQVGVNKETLPKILAAMNANKIPIFSQAGTDEVRRGVLLSIATPDFKLFGKFHAETIAKIFNGAKPRELNQVSEMPAKIAFNKAAARAADIRDDVYHLILKTADEVYEKIE
ncbi:MAG TPA: ABC transporter substrate-binding protein [Desulfobacteraceae bacterium]|nr:ABC transporter substrate-binding protein [Desulfobacteraceae bacterium]